MAVESSENSFSAVYLTSYTGLVMILLCIFLYLNGQGRFDASRSRSAVASITAQFPPKQFLKLGTDTKSDYEQQHFDANVYPGLLTQEGKQERFLRLLTELGISATANSDRITFTIPFSRIFKAGGQQIAPEIRADALPELYRVLDALRGFGFQVRVRGLTNEEHPIVKDIAYAQAVLRLFLDKDWRQEQLDIAVVLSSNHETPHAAFFVTFAEQN